MNDGSTVKKAISSLKVANEKLDQHSNCEFAIKIVKDTSLFTADAVTFNKAQKITIEGVNSDGNGNTEVAIDCDVHPGSDLFTCEGTVEFKYLALHFPTTLRKEKEKFEYYSLINGEGEWLSIKNTKFMRPSRAENKVEIALVEAHGGIVIMDTVECTSETENVMFKRYPFFFSSIAVFLSNLTFTKIETNANSVMCAWYYKYENIDVMVNRSTFSECKADLYGALYVHSFFKKSTFSIGDGGATTFSSCSSNYKSGSGGLYLQMYNIESANQIKWPSDGKNLIFKNCTAGEGESKRNIGLYIYGLNQNLFEELSCSMKRSFAANYTQEDNSWFIAGFDSISFKEFDFIAQFLEHSPKTKTENSTEKGSESKIEQSKSNLQEGHDVSEKKIEEDVYSFKMKKEQEQSKIEGMTFNSTNPILGESEGKQE
eukprot:MONOS_16123.1-p1 / transcript=MONOS_16123.1 / gene=MONOS_16123 / organism=Monocercomonoides_exilis_PA203 / gene_product=unspecified product / transcript_product=unspecified product / location=Mono_scaffold01516:5792-7078(-) / protein_length=429 / sequence_SO=supercontig / SO=protein_coding / is_pseudo=false